MSEQGGPDHEPATCEHCRWCGATLEPVEVHGHVQCAACGINVDPCCGGEQA